MSHVYPEMIPVRQRFAGPRVEDVAGTVREQFRQIAFAEKIRPGQSVAITAGSRGIANIVDILRATVEAVRECGGEPFIVPAMGSHGGGTADGQLQILASLGVTEASCHCPLRASMDTVVVCQSDQGFDVHFDRHAYDAEHVIVCGRIKAHTSFTGDIQSGLMKMLLIGLGKHAGATIYHRAFRDYSFDEIVRSVAATVIDRCGITAGLAIVENGYEDTALLEAVLPEAFVRREPELLQSSRDWMAQLPFPHADLLIVDRMGKDISGTGMDTNVIGRKFDANAARETEWPKLHKIFVRGLTDATHGNATGIGLADVTTQQVIDAIDYEAMRVNCVTSGRTAVGMLPLTFPTEHAAVDAALSTGGLGPASETRILHIADTLHLETVWCSAAYLPEIERRDDLEVCGAGSRLAFDSVGTLVSR